MVEQWMERLGVGAVSMVVGIVAGAIGSTALRALAGRSGNNGVRDGSSSAPAHESVEAKQRQQQQHIIEQQSGKRLSGRFKMVIVANMSLKMGKGKLAAQCAHSVIDAFEHAVETNGEWVQQWQRQGQMKVVVKAPNAEFIMKLMRVAEDTGLPFALIEDAGLTQIAPGSVTALAIGPAPAEFVDSVTGNLKLM
eukprot:m.362144 g.362144  ORF g.362144 m.362144 type:complete len:194 (-) comp20168_c0_seq1:270-851(-)